MTTFVASLTIRERLALALLVVFAMLAVAAPWIAPFDPTVSGDLVAEKLQPPSATHWLGTDAAARDVLSRLLFGTRISLGTAALTVIVVLAVGVTWGALAGLSPAPLDRFMMGCVEVALATPRLLVVLALVAFLGRLSPPGLAMVLGLTGWPAMSRLVRARVRETVVSDHVTAARALGTPPSRLVIRHVLPEAWQVVAAGVVTTIAAVIPLEAGLSFFGAGIAPPDASWGTLLQDASARPLDHWWLLLFPSLAIAATVMSVSVLGDRFARGQRHLPTA
jgi:ABC-type dipeptide/oligopeptide/nickel transport system permease subunit